VIINPDEEDVTLAEAVAAKCLGSVATIYVYSDSASTNPFGTGGSSSSTPSSLGSGVIISNDGGTCYIVTNSHVVNGASRAEVTIGDNRYEAQIVGQDAKTDLAVVSIKATGYTPMEWGDSADLTVGEWVMAIGTPYGYEQTVTTGIISAMYRSDVVQDATGSSSVYTDMIQTDAAINPGNSGGALVNDKGELIGINTYISSTSQSSAGLGFAIPSSTVKRVAEQLIAGKTVTHAFLGITMVSSTDPSGVAITSVYKDTGAARGGLQTGDVITKIDGKAMTSPSDVSIAVSSKNAGDTIQIRTSGAEASRRHR
ncbi:MAG: S1C family serine protease, partial [Bacteroidales bacterium]